MNISFSQNGLLDFALKPFKQTHWKILFLLLLTWLPLFISTLFFNSKTNGVTIFSDFDLHIRFLILLPAIVYMERRVDLPFNNFLDEMKHIIGEEDQGKYDRFIISLMKVITSKIPEVLFYILFYSLLFIYWDDIVMLSKKDYLFTSDRSQLNFSGWYYLLLSLPFFQLMIFRWIFRWVMWAYMIFKISKFKLQIDPVHADIMGGLEFINLIPIFFSFLVFLIASIIASNIGFEIVFEGQSLKPYAFQIAFFSLFFPILNYSPLFFFTRKMFKAKTNGIIHFGRLIREHNVAYFQKWIYNRNETQDELLGSVDNSSLSDINGSYTMTQSLRIIPINSQFFISTVLVGVLPYLPLLLTQYSITELFKQLIMHFMS